MGDSRRPSAIFGEHLLAARKAHGLSQRDLSEWMTRLGRPVSQSSIARLERGEREDLPLDEALSLAWLLEASPAAWLLPAKGARLAMNDDRSLSRAEVARWLGKGRSPEEGYRIDGSPESAEAHERAAKRTRAFYARKPGSAFVRARSGDKDAETFASRLRSRRP